MLERRLGDGALSRKPGSVVIEVVKSGDAQSAQHRLRGHRPNGGANLKRFLIIRIGMRPTFSVVNARLNVAEIARQVVMKRDSVVRGKEETFAIDEHGALQTIP